LADFPISRIAELTPPPGRPETNHRIRHAVSRAVGKTGTLDLSPGEQIVALRKGEIDLSVADESASLVTPEGEEKETRLLPANTPMDELIDRLEDILGGLNVPFEGIRV
jgi:hypothetical protein